MIREAEVEERLVVSMRDHVAGVSLDRQILLRASQRYQRRKTMRRTAFGAGAMAAVAILALVVVTGSRSGMIEPVGRDTGSMAQARLVAAIVASQSTSFYVTIKVDSKRADRAEVVSITVDGAYDPVTDSGYMRTTDSEERLVAGVRYVIRKGMAIEVPKFRSDLSLYQWPGGNGFLGTTADPTTMLDAMRQRDAKIAVAGVGAYHFAMTVPREDPRGQSNVAIDGDVLVGADNRVAKVIYKSIVSGFTNAELMTVMEFFGYGTPVKVEKP